MIKLKWFRARLTLMLVGFSGSMIFSSVSQLSADETDELTSEEAEDDSGCGPISNWTYHRPLLSDLLAHRGTDLPGTGWTTGTGDWEYEKNTTLSNRKNWQTTNGPTVRAGWMDSHQPNSDASWHSSCGEE